VKFSKVRTKVFESLNQSFRKLKQKLSKAQANFLKLLPKLLKPKLKLSKAQAEAFKSSNQSF
jgi:hypothetical protein